MRCGMNLMPTPLRAAMAARLRGDHLICTTCLAATYSDHDVISAPRELLFRGLQEPLLHGRRHVCDPIGRHPEPHEPLVVAVLVLVLSMAFMAFMAFMALIASGAGSASKNMIYFINKKIDIRTKTQSIQIYISIKKIIIFGPDLPKSLPVIHLARHGRPNS